MTRPVERSRVEALRLEAACRLLETTTETVDQIARACGYANTETLHRAFRRRMNTTPGEHRHHFCVVDVTDGPTAGSDEVAEIVTSVSL